MTVVSITKDTAYYLAAARREPVLEQEEEAELARRWRLAGDRRAADALVRSHFRQVVGVAMKFRHYGVPIGDLVAEGNLGVVKALARFQPERGLRFGTYANYWVRARMLAYVVRSYSSVSGADGPMRSQIFFKLRRERARVCAQFGVGDVADEALAARMGVSADRLSRMLQRLDYRDVSLDAKASGHSSSPLERMAASDDQEGLLLHRQVQGRLREAVSAAVAKLLPRERYIAEHRLMADPEEQLCLAEIARIFNVSRERVRQLETRLKRKLRAELTSTDNALVRELVEPKAYFASLVATPPQRRARKRQALV